MLRRPLEKDPERRKILLVVPRLAVLGGGEAVAAWMLQALREDYDLSVLTWTPSIAEDDINRFYGTSLTTEDFRLLGPPPPLRALFDLLARWNARHEFLKRCLLYRLTRRLKDRFDIMIAPTEELDFGRPGIQYVTFPGFVSAYLAEQRAISQGWWPRNWGLLRQRLHPWRMLSGLSFEGIKKNLTLACSDWSGEAVHQLYGINTATLYPPVAVDFPKVAWEQRKNRFVCVGRFVAEKRLELVIDILAAVRAQGYDLELQLIGLLWDDPAGRAYYHKVKCLAQKHATWVSLAENVDRQQVAEMISHSRYGIHASELEPFGIAVAEMIRAGCIAFTGRIGGQAEIIGRDERLMFGTVDEGVRKIVAVLRSPEQQSALRDELAVRGTRFSSEQFVGAIRKLVRQFHQDHSERSRVRAVPGARQSDFHR